MVPLGSVALGSQYPVVTGQRVNFSCVGVVRGVWWFRTAADTGVISVGAWRGGVLVGSGSGVPSGFGWVYLPFGLPVSVSFGDSLVVGVFHPNGSYATAVNGFTGRSVVSSSGCMVSPVSTASLGNGLYNYSAGLVLPTLSYAGSEYYTGPDFFPTN